MNNLRYGCPVIVALGLLPSLASAHITGVPHNHFADGFMHPLSGLDHLLAMLSVGIVSTQMGQKHAIWTLPAAFVAAMVIGGLMGISGLYIAGIETGIALSVLLLGAYIFFDSRLPTVAIYVSVMLFALCHGYAHGAEMPHQARALPFVLGFVMGTIAIHIAGVAIGLSAIRIPRGLQYIQAAGGFIAVAGMQFLLTSI